MLEWISLAAAVAWSQFNRLDELKQVPNMVGSDMLIFQTPAHFLAILSRADNENLNSQVGDIICLVLG